MQQDHGPSGSPGIDIDVTIVAADGEEFTWIRSGGEEEGDLSAARVLGVAHQAHSNGLLDAGIGSMKERLEQQAADEQAWAAPVGALGLPGDAGYVTYGAEMLLHAMDMHPVGHETDLTSIGEAAAEGDLWPVWLTPAISDLPGDSPW
jgi:hypothetical protein